MASILRDWVTELQIREQGTLLSALRGCDTAPKFPLDSLERQLTAYIRYCVCHPADQREVDSEPGCFMRSTPPDNFKPSALGHYPLHWVMHVTHALEIIGYRHPEVFVSMHCFSMYSSICRSLHLPVESVEDMTARLGEDRIANGNIVS